MSTGAIASSKFGFIYQIAGKINGTIRELGLRELGQLEQDLVFGDAGMKDVIKFLTTKEVRIIVGHILFPVDIYLTTELQFFIWQDTTRENKLRLLMILAAIYPDKFEGEKGLNLMKVGVLVTVYQLNCIFLPFYCRF